MNAQTRIITGLFDTYDDAIEARDDLIAAGVSQDAITMVEGSRTDATGSVRQHEDKGFWEALGDLFFPDDEREIYEEGLRRGGYLLTVRTTHEMQESVIAILDREGSVDLDERVETWRSEGWSGTGSTAMTDSTLTGDSAMSSTMGTERTESWSDTSASRTGAAGGARDMAGNEGKISVVREDLSVGKREIDKGRVRVRSYVVEEPVEADVSLRQEHVRVERRPVDRPVEAGDHLFTDKVVEVRETVEEAVVNKSARVVEEIEVAKDVDTHTETVRDTVRHTEVDIEDERSGSVTSRDDVTRRDDETRRR